MKCMNEEEKMRFRALTKEWMLGQGRKLEGKRDFCEKKRFGSRENREVSRYLSLKRIESDLRYI